MWVFNKYRKKVENSGDPSMSDKVAGKIAGVGLKLQRKFAERMTKIFGNMNNGKLKILLIFFCMTTGGYSVYLIADAIKSSRANQKSFKIDQVDVPKHFDKTGDAIIPGTYVDDETFYKIEGFKNYMDSLKQNKSKQYDSILLARPGLMDSVQMLGELYFLQKQK